MAAYHSYEAWSVSGIDPSLFSMESLDKKVPTEPLLLFIAGGIMVVTLWFSKKAKSVAETEINLSRQGDGNERFEPNLLSKSIVRGSSKLSALLTSALPKPMQLKLASSFETP